MGRTMEEVLKEASSLGFPYALEKNNFFSYQFGEDEQIIISGFSINDHAPEVPEGIVTKYEGAWIRIISYNTDVENSLEARRKAAISELSREFYAKMGDTSMRPLCIINFEPDKKAAIVFSDLS